MYYRFNETTLEGVFIHPEIKTNILALENLINDLDSNDLVFVAMNDDGVILQFKDVTGDPVLETRVKTNEETLISFNSNILDLKYRIEDVYREFNSTMRDTPSNKEEPETGEYLYLLWEFLPDEIKKKLKIYIKKNENTL